MKPDLLPHGARPHAAPFGACIIRRFERYGVPLVLGLCAGLGFAPADLWPLAVGALILLMGRLAGFARSRSAAIDAAIFATALGVTSLSWIASAFAWQDGVPTELAPFAVIVLSAYLALYWAVSFGLAHRLARGDRLVFALAAAALFVLAEWTRGIAFTGFGWNPLGGIWLSVPDISRNAAIFGTLGLSGLTVLAAGLIASAADGARPAVILAILVGAELIAFPKPATPPDTAQKISVVQADIAQDDKWRKGFAERSLDHYLGLTHRPPGAATSRVIFWPEAAITQPLENNAAFRARLGNALVHGELLMTGGIGTTADGAPTNSVFLVGDSGEILGRYDKQHLVPFGEYLPFRPLASAIGLEKFVPGASDIVAGPVDAVIAAGAPAASVAICYEISFAGEMVSRETRPAFIFNPSNDAWFGPHGPPQHLAQARLRAIELGLPVIRATQTGISAVIRSDGSVAASIPANRVGRLDTSMPAALPPTVYARWGDLLPLGGAIVLLLFAIRRRWRLARG